MMATNTYYKTEQLIYDSEEDFDNQLSELENKGWRYVERIKELPRFGKKRAFVKFRIKDL
jgi:hypothetical protein